MYGRKVHEVVLASGARETGATVHQVIADYDTGPVLGQIRIPVLPQDTVERLEARVKVRERELLVETIGKLLEDLG